MKTRIVGWCCASIVLSLASVVSAQGLESQLLSDSVESLAKAARSQGDAKRGAIVFYQPYMACTKCHTSEPGRRQLGPKLTEFDKKPTDAQLVESVLHPSKVIRKGFETITVQTADGVTINGLVVKETGEVLTLRDPSQDGKLITLEKDGGIDAMKKSDQSIMPKGLVNQISGRQQFLDLVRYLIEIAEGGASRALELKPAPSLYAARPLPEYEKKIDHAGMIGLLDQAAFKRGEAIYNRLCVNCHGTHDRPGSLPTSLRFASDKFKNGSDPYTMYQTLTRGFGMMVQQSWMVPQQKYDVIHYIREAYLKTHNPTQLAKVSDQYLAGLPKGDTRGPAPSKFQPWSQMDYGVALAATYEVGSDASNFAYKGIAARLDEGPGGVSQGQHWTIFDHDTLRLAAGWSGKGFIDWRGINFNGQHGAHPRVAGEVQFQNPTGPGWADPETGSFKDVRFLGRDDRPYGPLPRKWAQYKGLYQHSNQIVVSYTVGNAAVLEHSRLVKTDPTAVMARTFNIGPRDRDMILQVAKREIPNAQLTTRSDGAGGYLIVHSEQDDTPVGKPALGDASKFEGNQSVEIAKSKAFDFSNKDFSLLARIRTKKGGTILAKAPPAGQWAPNGKTLFVRNGRLCFDIGWVGVIQSKKAVGDGKFHDVAMTYDAKAKRIQLFIDGKLDTGGVLGSNGRVGNHVVRLGYTSTNFPRPRTHFDGVISDVHVYQRALKAAEIAGWKQDQPNKDGLLAAWKLGRLDDDGNVVDLSGNKHSGRVARGKPAVSQQQTGALIAGLSQPVESAKWLYEEGNVRLKIPAGKQPLQFTLWLANADSAKEASALSDTLVFDAADEDLSRLTKGSPRRWPEVLKTQATVQKTDGPFAVDVLTRPVNNPWFCRMRLTGLDFYDDEDRMAVCMWEGNVFEVSGLSKMRQSPDGGSSELSWKRIASGLFQPLGIRIIEGKIHLTCRDQLVVLHDLNDDGETDFYECLNNDHQVTEHFHEFAMGLQTDDAGNFYYAKSARHAKTALVPHHGTLLKVSKDGEKTEILANGFRAANGVCLNPDGTFIVTDQEGHWNPKNRINWVKKGGFYGNMFGYHDVKDHSDSAMQQPLCWITNAFDRSPAELLWVDSKKWGALDGTLLNLSYGYGKVYVVPHEEIDGQTQGGMCQLPISQFPTGVMRGRFHPKDGQLYCCGMFAWAGNQHQPGGLYRLRYTGKPANLPLGLKAKKGGMLVTFSDPVNRDAAETLKNYAVKTWSLKRTASYGSKHYDEMRLEVRRAELANDGKSVFLEIPDIKPTWCMEIKYSITDANGKPINGTIHNTIHKLGE